MSILTYINIQHSILITKIYIEQYIVGTGGAKLDYEPIYPNKELFNSIINERLNNHINDIVKHVNVSKKDKWIYCIEK